MPKKENGFHLTQTLNKKNHFKATLEFSKML